MGKADGNKIMKPGNTGKIEMGGFVIFLGLVTLALIIIVWPFASALLWAVLAAIVFQPLYHRNLGVFGGHENRAAIATLLVITVAVIIPALIIGSMIADQAIALYLGIRAQEIDAATYFVQIHEALPIQLQRMLDDAGYGDFENLRMQLSEFVRTSAGMIARQLLAFGGSAFAWVLSFAVGLYATYFLLRDGQTVGASVTRALPLPAATARKLADNFTLTVRATIKGSVVVGLVQGALGAITFWIVGMPSALLFGLLMAIFSLLPALGPAIVWLPVALYLFATGAIWQGIVVVASGVVVIGMADNILRPILVGRDTGLPDWVVLVTTLGGIATLGLSGIVIGPVVAGLFLTAWSVLSEQRKVAAPVG